MDAVLDRESSQTAGFAPVSSEEFHYRPMSMLAVLGCVLGGLSAVLLLMWLILPVAGVALVISGLAIWKIRQSQGELTGLRTAVAGAALSAVGLFGGLGYQFHAYRSEVPTGYQRISFALDVSKAEPDGIRALDGRRVFLKGFMYPTKETEGRRTFLLVLDSGECCFGGKPKPTDMIGVYMSGQKTVNLMTGRVSVAGTFRINTKYTGESELEPMFLMEGDIVSYSRSDFDPVHRARLEPLETPSEEAAPAKDAPSEAAISLAPAASEAPAATAVTLSPAAAP